MRYLGLALSLFVFVEVAAAHGGGFRHPPPVQRGILCDCAKIECKKCSSKSLRNASGFTCQQDVTEVKRWGDIARVRATVTFRTGERFAEGYARIDSGPVFAAVAGELRNGDEQLAGALQKSEKMRRIYLYERRMAVKDPLLVLRRAPGKIDVRVFPLAKDTPAVATIEGYVLAAPPRSTGVRLYKTPARTGVRYLAIVPFEEETRLDEASFVDVGNRRVLHFLSEAECSARHGTESAIAVPCVPALETAVTGLGVAATGEQRALAALAEGCRLPPFIGPDRSAIPPGMRPPSDPQPPPPSAKPTAPAAAPGRTART